MKERLKKLEAEVLDALKGAKNIDSVETLKTKYLGRKGPVSALLKDLGKLPGDMRREAGQAINQVKVKLEEKLDAVLMELKAANRAESLKSDVIDVTLPGRKSSLGALHPVTSTLDDIESIFLKMGFEIAEGPEVESDYYNFESLNIPKDHPAREMQDTFYISDDVVLRTHTSPVQIRIMENSKPPLKIIAPGTVYRRDSDITHTPMFHQIEGFMVDENITFADLKGTLTHFLTHLFGAKTQVRFRPSFFPFTEPSAEVDIECVICKGSGSECRVCKGTGWLEILGCGMIHPAVFKGVNCDSEKYTGFAFGMGIERITMLRYGIGDLRMFFENDIRFLSQFK